MKITGCIVTYNNIKVIEACIDSVLKTTKDMDFKLFVVDNGSTDGTKELIRRKYKEVVLLAGKKNLGFGRANNAVLNRIDSDFHVIINPDIFLSENTIRILCEYMESHDDVVMATPKILNEDGSEQFLPKYCPTFRYVIVSKFKPFKYLRKQYTRENEKLSLPTEIEFSTGCFSVIKTDVFKKLGGFDRRFFMYCEDADLSRRARECGRIIYYPNAAVTHRWGRDNIKNIKGVFRFINSLTKYFLKWGFKF